MALETATPHRLCIVNPYQHGGGAEYQISCLIDVLRATGKYDIHYLARYTDDQAARGRYRVTRIEGSSKLGRVVGYLADAPSLWGALRRIQPAVIYQRVACGYTGICGRYARSQGTRFVWHVAHDSDVIPVRDPEFYGNPIRRRFEKRLIEYGLRHATHVVTQTETQARLLRDNYGRSPDAIVANFHPEPPDVIDKSGPLTVLWVANLKRIKRPDVFVRLARSLRDLRDVQFVMVGPKQFSAHDASYEKQVMDGIAAAPNLSWRGKLPQDEVNRLLAGAHVFVNSSEQEGFPNTFIQAWMRAVPVVSLSVNPDDVLERARVGVFARTEEGLATAVRALLTDREQREQYAARARAYALAHHSTRNALRLEELLATGRAAPAADVAAIAQT